MENETRYGCPGCGGEVSQQEYQDGQKTCNDENCDRHGQPLEKLQFCASCNEYYSQDAAGQHEACG